MGVEGADATVHIEITLFAGGEGEGSGFDGLGEEEGAQVSAVGFDGHGYGFRREREEGKFMERKRRWSEGNKKSPKTEIKHC